MGGTCWASGVSRSIAGPLIRLDEASVPDWMVIWEHDFDMLREMAYEYVQKVVQPLSAGRGGLECRSRGCRRMPRSR